MVKIKGNVDLIALNVIRGWAVNTGNPAEKLTIEVFIDDRKICSALANQYRHDLVQAKIGDGYCAFNIEVNLAIEDLKR